MDHNRFDVTMKGLIPEGPPAWVERFGLGPPGQVREIDAGIATLSASADKVYHVKKPKPHLVDFEFQSSPASELVRTLWYRQVALDYKHNLPVLTVLLLLRKEANSPKLNGVYDRELPDRRPTNRYYYHVVRLWEQDPEPFLTGHVSLVPLAPLTAVSGTDLPRVVRRVKERIGKEPRPSAVKLHTATSILMGLPFPDKQIKQLLGGVEMLKESTVYQRIFREGRKEGQKEGQKEGRLTEAHRFLIRLATKRFGKADAKTVAALEAIQDADRLEAFGERLVAGEFQNWKDLLRSS